MDEAFEQFDLSGLWVAVIHHLIQKFIYDDKVVPNRLLLQILKIVFEDVDEGVQEGEDHDGVVIFPRDGD
jgi:hypothetical protein